MLKFVPFPYFLSMYVYALLPKLR